MRHKYIAALAILVTGALQANARAALRDGAGKAGDPTGGGQITTWVLGAINGGISRPAGTSSCSAWSVFDGSTTEGAGLEPTMINPATGQVSTVYFRVCDGRYQFVYVGQHTVIDIAEVAYQKVAALVPRPEASFSPPVDKMIVNFETWLAVTPSAAITATAAVPGLSATVTAQPTDIEWATGSQVAGDTTLIACQPWGSTSSAQDGCTWTPTYPSVAKVTGTTDQRYHGTVTIVWQVSWQASNGASGSLGALRTTSAVAMGVQEIQTIGG
jgi:hypothetical protein